MRLDVATDPITEWLFAQKAFEHPKKGLPLLIGNVIERIIRFSLSGDWLLDRVRGCPRVAFHCLLLRNTDPPSGIARNRLFEPDFPLRIEMRCTFRPHPRGESFV